MKKINLIEWLWKTDSHEKQKPQRFGRYAAMLIMLLTLGVGQMWANYAYMDLTGFTHWYDGNAWFRLDKNGNGNVDSKTEIGSTGVWRFDIGDYTGDVTYKRMQPNTTNQWNYANGSISSSQNVCRITGWDNSGTMQTSFVINYIHGTNHVYFDNSTSNFTGNIYFVIGHDYSPTGSSSTYSKAYKMTQVSNTSKLWYVSVTDEWADATYYAIIGNSAASISETGWGSSSLSSKGSGGYTKAYKTVYNMEGGSYLITTASSGNNKDMTITYKDGYGSLPKLNATQSAKKRDTGTSYSTFSGSWPASIKLQGTHMSGNGSTGRNTITSTASTDGSVKTTYEAVKTGLITHTYTSLSSSYYFEGWGTGSTPSSTDATYSYNISAATTVYAFFSKLYTLNFDKKGTYGTSTISASVANYDDVDSGDEVPTGHTISATATIATGYEIEGWYSDAACTSPYTNGSGGVTISGAGNKDFSITSLNSNSGIYCKFRPKTYSITLEGGDGSDGEATATYKSSTLTSITHSARPSYDLNGYYTATSGGTKVINANGTLVASAGSYTNSSSEWIYDDDVELHAQWTYNPTLYDVTFGVGTSYTSLGSLSAAVTSTSAAISSGDDLVSGTGITFTASPNTGYEVAGFYSDASCETLLQSGNTTTYTIASLSSDVTVYVKFVEKTWSVAFAAGTGGTVTTPAATPQTVGQVSGISIAATPATGYTFNTWTITSGSGSFTSAATTNSNTFKPTAASTITASFNETKSTITVTTATSSQGSLKFGSTSKSWGATASLGVATTQEITATAAAGFRFVRWDLTGAAASASSLTSATITLKADGSGSTGTATAVFEEDLSSPWIVAGGNKIVTTGTTWRTTADANNSMVKKTGHSTESVVYFTVPVTSVCSGDNNENFQFKIYNTSTRTWYGLFASGSYYLLKAEDGTEKSLVKDNQNIELRAYVTGDYEFKLDYSTSTPKLTVTWPVFNQVRISAASPTDVGNVGNYDLSEPVSNVRTVTRSLKANTTYTFKIVYNSDFYGYNSGTFTRSTSTSSNSLTTSTSGGDMTLTTDYAGSYTFKFNESTKALSIDFPEAYKVTYGKGTVDGSVGHNCSAVDLDNSSAAVTSNSTWVKSGHQVMLTAPNEDTGYTFDGWFDNNAGTGTEITKAKNCTITVSSAETYYACYHENMHDVTITTDGSGGGSITSPAGTPKTVSAGISTASSTITATPTNAAWRFHYWEIPGDGSITIVGGDNTASSITIKATADSKTIIAHFQPRFALVGSLDADGDPAGGMPADGSGKTWNNYYAADFTVEGFTALGSGVGKGVDLRCSRTLEANKRYKFRVLDRSKWSQMGCTSDDILEADANWQLNQTGDGSHDVHINTVGKGTYTFKITNLSSDGNVYPSITVLRQASHSATFGYGTGGSAVTASGSTSGSITSGQYVAVGENVTFTQTPATGYTFKGWYTTPGGNTTVTGMGVSDNVYETIGANINVYAQYNAKTYTVTLTNSGTGYGSSGQTTLTATFDAAFPSFTLPTAATSYAFMGYFDAANGEGTQFTDASGNLLADIEDYSDESGHWKYDANDLVLYAYYKQAEITKLTHDNHVAKASTAYLTVNPTIDPASGVQGVLDICWSLFYADTDNPVDAEHWSVAKYTEGDSKPNQVKYTLTNLENGTYKIKAVLKANATAFSPCSGGTELMNISSTFRVVGDNDVTIRYVDNATGNSIAASGSVVVEADGSQVITAPSVVGYTFHHWVIGDGVALVDGTAGDASTPGSASITISATYDGIVTARYNKKNMIYFYNTLEWTDVYVYFYMNDAYWAGDALGTGACTQQCFGTNCGNEPYHHGEHGRMTQIEGTNIWYFDYEAAGFTHWNGDGDGEDIAFANVDQHTSASKSDDISWFRNANVVRRGDYKTSLPMFVPLAGQTPVHADNSHADSYYYSTGYWMNYPDNTGYTLKIFNKKANSDSPDSGKEPVQLKSIPFEFSADKKMPLSITVDLEAGQTYGFKIYRNDGNWYGNSSTMKNGASGDEGQTVWEATTGTTNCGLTTTSTGDYVFKLNYGLDNYSNYNFLIGVKYPEAVGDHRVIYTDAADWSSGTTHTSRSWTITSRVIPAVAGAIDTVSFFVSKGSSPEFKIEKVSSISAAGVPTWTQEVAWTSCNDVAEAGVYNFILTQDGSKNLTLSKKELYNGNFYIRVDGAGSTSWENYRADDHIMPYSEYSFNQTTDKFSHYYTHWYDCSGGSKNIKFVVANDYSPHLTDFITQDGVADDIVNSNGDLSRSANVRFMYNYKTNVATRRYVDGAQEEDSEFLLLFPSNNTSLYDAEIGGNAYTQVKFSDKGNWIYEAEVWAVPGTQYKLRSQFGEASHLHYQYFKGAASGAGEYETLIAGSSSSPRMKLRLLYDFKTNRLVSAWLPSGTISTNQAINADVMFIREGQGDMSQVSFSNSASITAITNVYSVLRINKWTINNRDASSHELLASPLSRYDRDLYWVSFPYDVKLSDVFGFGTYGKHWIIEYYDGAGRAEKGFWADSPTNWKFVTPSMRNSYTLKAGTGYILALDLDELWCNTDEQGNQAAVWDNIQSGDIIFPGNVASISSTSVEYTLPEHLCTINRGTTEGNRTIKDSHWNVLGVPAYHNTSSVSFSSETDEQGNSWTTSGKPSYFYTWNPQDNSLTPTNAAGYTFKSMHSYMVQYYGTVTYSTSTSPAPSPIVARRTYAEQPIDVDFRLEINKNGVMEDQTFVKLSNDEEVSADFVFGEDMSKEFNKNKANIYTFIGTEWVAGNTLPMSEQTTVVPVGVKIAKTGDYTFAIPSGTNGVGVTLVDLETGVRTNLALFGYDINLEAGDYNERFLLEISPVQHISEGVDEVNGEGLEANGVRKVLIDNVLYIIRDGKVFDAQGKRLH